MVVELTIGEILDKKNITESSKKLYLSNFKRLNDGEPVKGFKFILDIGVASFVFPFCLLIGL